MPVQKLRVDTDKGSYDIEVEMPEDKLGAPGKGVTSGNPVLGAAEGFVEGAAGGAKGFVKGIIPGILNGVKDTAQLPITILKELASTAVGAGHLATDPEATLRAAAEALANVPGQAAAKFNELADLAKSDPEGFGKTVGQLTGEAGVGVATSKLVPLAIKPVAKQAGQLAETVGKVGQWPIRMMGAHQLGSGNPMGIATMATPELLKRGGAALKNFGEGAGASYDEAMAARLPSSAREIDVPRGPIRTYAPQESVVPNTERVPITGGSATANSRVQKVMMDEAKSESAVAARKAAAVAKGENADPMIMGRRLSAYPPEVQAKYRATMASGSNIPAGDPARPAIRVDPASSSLLPTDDIARMGGRATQMGHAAVADMRNAGMDVPATGMRSTGDIDRMAAGPQPAVRTSPPLSDTRHAELLNKLGGTGDVTPTATFAYDWPEAGGKQYLIKGGPSDGSHVSAASLEKLGIDVPPDIAKPGIRVGGAPQQKIPIPPTKSRRTMSATPGLTVEDMQGLGLDPKIRLKAVTPEIVDKVLAARKARAETYRINAGLDKGGTEAMNREPGD